MPHIPHTLKGINNIYARTAELPRGRAHALPSTLSSLLPWENIYGRTAELPCGRAHARQPRTALSPLLPTLYFGSPLHSGHALPSPLFSLLSTLYFGYSSTDARQNCRAGAPTRANHALPSPPFSLLSTLSFPCGSNISPCKEEAVGVEDSGLTWGDGVDALWERGGDPSTGEWSERAGDRRLDRTRL